jgi:two-component system nitrate/nitrite sensor histidine kinase NarX
MRMALLQDALAAKDDAKATRYCQEVRAVASQAHASLRGILTHLRTPMDPLGLLHAIENSVQHFADQGGARIEFVNELPGLSLPEEHEAHVFHVVQEALNNIARHAGASQAWLHIAAGAPGMVRITIDDDGIGPAGAGGAGPSHYGLEIMHERARRIGGRLDVVPRSGGGTRVQLRFPLQQAGVGGLH